MASHANFSKIALVVLILVFVVGFGFYFYLDFISHSYGTYAVLPDGSRISLELARTDEERARGLSGRASLPPDKGMYFIFPSEDIYGFWMRDMQFPIDIIWVKHSVIVGIAERVPAEPGVQDTELKIYRPPEPVSSVLEVRAGSAARYGLTAGDKIRIQIVPDGK